MAGLRTERFNSQGLDPATSTVEEFGALIKSGIGRWNRVSRQARLKAQ